MNIKELSFYVGVLGVIVLGAHVTITHSLDKFADKLSNADEHYYMSSVRPLGDGTETATQAVMIEPRVAGEDFLICNKSDDGKFTMSKAGRGIGNGNYSEIISRPRSDVAIAKFCEKAFGSAEAV